MELEKLQNEILKPRRCKTKNNTEGDAANNNNNNENEDQPDGSEFEFSDTSSKNGEDDDDEENGTSQTTNQKPRGKYKKNRNKNDPNLDIISRNLSDKEIRRLIRSLRRYANPLERLEVISKDIAIEPTILPYDVLKEIIVTILGKLQLQYKENMRAKDKKKALAKKKISNEEEQDSNSKPDKIL